MATTRTDNLVIPQGVTWAIRWPLLDEAGNTLPTTGMTAKAQVRSRPSSKTVLHEWSTVLGNISFVDNMLELRLAPADTATWDEWLQKKAVYDVKITTAEGIVIRLVEGAIKVSEAVTR